jgi:hypothetical protein
MEAAATTPTITGPAEGPADEPEPASASDAAGATAAAANEASTETDGRPDQSESAPSAPPTAWTAADLESQPPATAGPERVWVKNLRDVATFFVGAGLIAGGGVLWWYSAQGALAVTGMALVAATAAELIGAFLLIFLVLRAAFIVSMSWLLPMLPAVAALATVAAYLGGLARSGPDAVFVALVATAIVWLLLAAGTTDRTRPSGAQVRAFSELRVQTDQLSGRLGVIAQSVATTPDLEEARTSLWRAKDVLDEDRPSGQWAAAIGYVNTWRTLHRCEEAMIYVEAAERVVSTALVDDLRLDGSAIPGRDRLQRFLQAAVHDIDAEAAERYLGMKRDGERKPTNTSDNANQLADSQARSMLREVRRAINDFRDARTEDIIKTRNVLRRTFAFTAVVAYTLLAVAVLVGAPASAVATVTGLFLIAALVGLFSRLNNTKVGTSTVDDFGLEDAQLLAGPLVSGIAGIGGVVLIAAAPVAAAALSATSTTGGVAASSLDFTAVFDLSKNPLSVVFAAVFGLTPTLFLSRLQDETEQLKKELRSSYVADKAAQDPAARTDRSRE